MDTPDRLRQLREERGYSKYHVANAVEMSQSTYSYWENKAPVQLAWLSAICKFYGVSADYILGITDRRGDYAEFVDQPSDMVVLADVVRGASASKRAEILEVARVMVAHEREELIAAMTGSSQDEGSPGDAPAWVVEVMERLVAAQADTSPQDGPPDSFVILTEEMIEALPEPMRTALLGPLVRKEGMATIPDAGDPFDVVTKQTEQQDTD